MQHKPSIEIEETLAMGPEFQTAKSMGNCNGVFSFDSLNIKIWRLQCDDERAQLLRVNIRFVPILE